MSDSHYQKAIIDWAVNGTGNVFGKGVAGCGKTYTGIRVVEELPGGLNIMSLAFNKSIATAAEKKFKANRKIQSTVTCKTLHGLGYRAMADYLNFQLNCRKINASGYRNWNVLENLMGGKDMSKEDNKLYKQIRVPVDKLVGLAKSLCILDAQEFRTRVNELVDHYEVEFDPKVSEHVEEWAVQTYIDSLEFRVNSRGKVEVSFDDMIFLPVWCQAKGELVRFQKFDWVMVDEAQDLNPTQIEMLGLIQKERMLLIGDPAQAIYGFRGSDGDTVNTLIETFDADVMPLSICYRCPKVVIEHAKQYVPEIEASPDAIEGELESIDFETFLRIADAGELVLCRTNAPLVKWCLKMIRQGKKALIKGREVGDTLAKIVKKCSPGGTMDELLDSLSKYTQSMMAQFEKRKQENKMDMLQDQYDTIVALVQSIEENHAQRNVPIVGPEKLVCDLIKRIFVDDPKEGVVFSSIHKAKGLESDTVWCLPSKPRKSSKAWVAEQEKNLLYVQCTRSMRRLFFVSEDAPKDNTYYRQAQAQKEKA